MWVGGLAAGEPGWCGFPWQKSAGEKGWQQRGGKIEKPVILSEAQGLAKRSRRISDFSRAEVARSASPNACAPKN